MIDFQYEFDNMPKFLKAILRTKFDREEMLILYTLENNHEEVQEILESAGVPKPKPCKKCYGRYRTGFKYPDAQIVEGEMKKGREVVVLCECVRKNLKKRQGKLLVDWEERSDEGKRKAATISK